MERQTESPIGRQEDGQFCRTVNFFWLKIGFRPPLVLAPRCPCLPCISLFVCLCPTLCLVLPIVGKICDTWFWGDIQKRISNIMINLILFFFFLFFSFFYLFHESEFSNKFEVITWILNINSATVSDRRSGLMGATLPVKTSGRSISLFLLDTRVYRSL